MLSTIRNSILTVAKAPVLYSTTRGMLTHSAFNHAAKKGDLETITKYLQQKFNPQLITLFKQNPIRGATTSNHALVLERLLSYIKEQQHEPDALLWQDALTIALEHNFEDCVKVFLRHSCKYPLIYTTEIVEAKTSTIHILMGKPVALIPKTTYCYVYHPAFGMSELHMYAGNAEDQQKQIDKACNLLHEDPKIINHAAKGGMTATHISAQEGTNAFLSFMLGRDANINATNAIGETPLGTAARFANLKSYQLLLSAGAKQTSNIYGKTPKQILAAACEPSFNKYRIHP